MLWFTIFIFNQREINYRRQIDRSKGVREVSDWHCHSSQHFLPEGIAPDLVMPGMLGTPPPFSNTSLVFFFNNHPLFFAGMPLTLGWAYSPTMAVKSKAKIHCRAEFTCVFDHRRFIVDLCSSMCARMSEWVWEKTSLAQSKKTKEPWFHSVFPPSWFTDALQMSSATFSI